MRYTPGIKLVFIERINLIFGERLSLLVPRFTLPTGWGKQSSLGALTEERCSILFLPLTSTPLCVRLAGRSYGFSYQEVAEEVLAETNLTATDRFKQNAVKFFDNKFNSLVPLKAAYFVQ